MGRFNLCPFFTSWTTCCTMITMHLMLDHKVKGGMVNTVCSSTDDSLFTLCSIFVTGYDDIPLNHRMPTIFLVVKLKFWYFKLYLYVLKFVKGFASQTPYLIHDHTIAPHITSS